MQRVAPSQIARQQLQELLSGGAECGSNIVSALVETVTRVVVQELLEGEQADYLGGRGRYERRGEGQVARATGTRRVGCALPRARLRWPCRRCAVWASRFGRR
jgi:hypothetical protein